MKAVVVVRAWPRIKFGALMWFLALCFTKLPDMMPAVVIFALVGAVAMVSGLRVLRKVVWP